MVPLALQPDRFGFARLDIEQEMTGAEYLDTFRLHRPTKEGKAKVGPNTLRCVPPVLVYTKPTVPTVGRDAREGETVAGRIISALRKSYQVTVPEEIYSHQDRVMS